MFGKRILTTAALVGLAAAPGLAQTAPPTSPSRPAMTTPSMTSPAEQSSRPGTTVPASPAATAASPQAARPATGSPASTATASKAANLNSATAQQLEALPEIGAARSKVILDERAKGKFKDWADFEKRMAGTSVNAGVMAKIKDHVTF